MNSVIEALPELAIAVLVAGLFFLLSKDKLSKSVRVKCLVTFAVLVCIWIIMLGQSSSVPQQLQVIEPEVSYEQPLVDVQDSSPKSQTADQSSERLAQLRKAQKQDTSLAEDKSEQETDQK